MKRLSSRTQFKIDFSLLFTSWRKVPGKKPKNVFFFLTECDGIGLVITKWVFLSEYWDGR